MAEEKMDIDVVEPSSQYSSAPNHTSSPAGNPLPNAKRAELSLPPDQLTAVYSELENTCHKKMWSTLFEIIGDSSQMEDLMSSVLVVITRLLSRTDLKATVLPVSNDDEAAHILEGFSADEIEEFKGGLRKGVVDRSWVDLVAHPKLYTTATNKRAIGVPLQFQHAVINAWSTEYRGKSAESLLQSIDDVHNQPIERRYAKIIPIIQSSGTGKSKTVDEIGKTRVLFPLCLREDIGTKYFAYPPVDTDVRNYLLAAPPASDENKCKSYLRAFMCAICYEAQNEIEDFALEGGGVLSYEDLATQFYEFFSHQSKRDSFYRRVLIKAPSLSGHPLTEASISLREALASYSTWTRTSAGKFCPIIQAIDEVHILFERRDVERESEHTLYSRFKSVLSEIRTEPFCVVFLSTAGTVSELAPSQDVAPSIRERSDELELPSPFTELPFDVDLISTPLVPGKESIRSVGNLEFTVQFGRPMFSATYRSRKLQEKDDGVIATGMIEIIRHKLCGLGWPPRKPAVLDASSIAVLSARFLLDLSPSASQTRKLDEEQVRSHLRMLYSVQRNRRVAITGSSPEPLIAEAAAITMYYRIEDGPPYMDIWALLGKFIDDGLAPQGTIGELLGRVFSILAMDRAILDLPENELRPLKYQTPVTVTAYYKALLSDDAWEKLRLSVPINRRQLCADSASTTFENAFAEAYLHFSHYAKANDDTPFKDGYAWALWLRGTAILGQLNQHLTDRGLPIHFPGEGGLCAQSMSVILDQDKTGQSENPTIVKAQCAEVLKLFSDGKVSLPYIDAVHCYALTANQGIIVTNPSPHEATFPPVNLEAPRYRIDIRGLNVYKNISRGLADNIRGMIDGTKDALFKYHPRQNAVPLLRQMQPLLNGQKETTAWFGGFYRR